VGLAPYAVNPVVISAPGSSGQTLINVSSSTGFSGAIALSCSALPAGRLMSIQPFKYCRCRYLRNDPLRNYRDDYGCYCHDAKAYPSVLRPLAAGGRFHVRFCHPDRWLPETLSFSISHTAVVANRVSPCLRRRRRRKHQPDPAAEPRHPPRDLQRSSQRQQRFHHVDHCLNFGRAIACPLFQRRTISADDQHALGKA
jgi:hypothetical protein